MPACSSISVYLLTCCASTVIPHLLISSHLSSPHCRCSRMAAKAGRRIVPLVTIDNPKQTIPFNPPVLLFIVCNWLGVGVDTSYLCINIVI
ncbi:hypothetical protein DFH09DRAFT_1145319 [Mycena vulgaris]|nr:hypothetical protein DFH09DRAFT_1145319 [Mycena vulgaris]